jgi:hypothetical protein
MLERGHRGSDESWIAEEAIPENKLIHIKNKFIHIKNKFIHIKNNFFHIKNKFIHIKNKLILIKWFGKICYKS